VIADDQLWSVQPCTCSHSGSDLACTKRVQQNHGEGFLEKINKNIILVVIVVSDRASKSWLGFGDFRSTSGESGKPWYRIDWLRTALGKKKRKKSSSVTVTVTVPGIFAGGGASLVGVCFDLISCCRFDMVPGMNKIR